MDAFKKFATEKIQEQRKYPSCRRFNPTIRQPECTASLTILKSLETTTSNSSIRDQTRAKVTARTKAVTADKNPVISQVDTVVSNNSLSKVRDKGRTLASPVDLSIMLLTVVEVLDLPVEEVSVVSSV